LATGNLGLIDLFGAHVLARSKVHLNTKSSIIGHDASSGVEVTFSKRGYRRILKIEVNDHASRCVGLS